MRSLDAAVTIAGYGWRSVPVLLLAVLVACGNAIGGPSRYYVDFAHGDDGNRGTSTDEPWKHAPGDPLATGNPASTRLAPGDRVIFAAGVVYRGEIRITVSGSATTPIVFEGAPGGPAVIDGSDSLSFARCASAAQCGDLPNWRNLVRVTLPSPLPSNFKLFSDKGYLRPARSPDPKDDFYVDEPDDMLPVPPSALAAGEVPLPDTAMATTGLQRRVAIWVQPNVVEERPVSEITGGVVRFSSASLKYYTDRPGRYAVIGIAGALDRPGEYIVLPDGQHAVLMPPPGTTRLGIASGRGGFHLQKASHIAIRNLTFRHMADGGNPNGGIAILSQQASSSGIAITGNRFNDMNMPRGMGPIILNRMSDVTIANNTIERIVAGSGMRLGGPARAITIAGNRIDRIGRTGIMLMNVEDALIEGNVVTNIKGVHGNGMSAYLGNRNIRFVHNTVLDAKAPVTFHGMLPPAHPLPGMGIEFRENLLVADTGAPGSLIAWGEVSRDITMTRNVLLGGRSGLRIPPGNQDVAAVGNVGVRPPPNWSRTPPGWRMEGNRWFGEPPSWAGPLTRLAAASATQGTMASFDCRLLFGDQKVEQIGANIACAP